jgi:hypothetical protein
VISCLLAFPPKPCIHSSSVPCLEEMPYTVYKASLRFVSSSGNDVDCYVIVRNLLALISLKDIEQYINNKFWEELITYSSFIRHLKQFFRCCGNLFTEPLPSNDSEKHIQTHRLVGGTYEVRRWDGLQCHGIHTKFHKDWSRDSKVAGGIHSHTDSMVIS